jgi:hypothetical protein
MIKVLLTSVGKILSDGCGQSCFSMINVAYFIIIKYIKKEDCEKNNNNRSEMNVECIESRVAATNEL